MQNSDDTAPLGNKVEGDLVRAIGTGSLAASILNMVVGAGIFALPALVVAAIGTAAPLAYVLCSILVGLVFLCFAEAGSRVTGSGGAYACVEAAFGPLAGFLVSTLLWFGVGVLSCAAISNVIADTLASAWPWTGYPSVRLLLLFLLFGGLAAINVAGVRSASRFVVLNTTIKLVPLLMLIAAGLPAIHWDNLAVKTWPPLDSLGATSLLLFFAFGGAELALTPSGEIQDPSRTVPRAILLGLGGVLALYLSVQGVAQGVLGMELAQHKGSSPRSRSRTSPGELLVGHCLCSVQHSLSLQRSVAAYWPHPGHSSRQLEDGLLPPAWQPFIHVFEHLHSHYRLRCTELWVCRHRHVLSTRHPLQRVRAPHLLCRKPFGAWAQAPQSTSIATSVLHSWRSTRASAQLHGRPVGCSHMQPGLRFWG